MKINEPVTGNEISFPESGILVSQTDLRGVITYANQAFVDISGFSRSELIGQSHNVVRHPDMPPQVFGDLWRTVKAGRPPTPTSRETRSSSSIPTCSPSTSRCRGWMA